MNLVKYITLKRYGILHLQNSKTDLIELHEGVYRKGLRMAKSTYTNKKSNVISHHKIRRREQKILQQILKEGESPIEICRGTYVGGKGLLIGTSERLILVDTKRLSNYIRTLQYQRIDAINHSSRAFESFLFMTVKDSKFVFRTRSKDALRKLTAHIHYNSNPKNYSDMDFTALLNKPVTMAPVQTFVPRHRHGKFSVLPQ